MKNEFVPDRVKLLDNAGRPLTQALFLELGYSEPYAMYTLKEQDHTWNGKLYPSIKKLYIEADDPTEYAFATKYFLSWSHWKRLVENKVIGRYIAEWREELEIKLRSQAIRDIQNLCASENGNYQAAKFLADRGWDKRGAGRPSKQEEEKRAAIAHHIETEFDTDVARMDNYRKS
jgi:hypothetical protein